ncbi:hypothetical protein BFP76_10815 [Amylibacter kogurei]|uniref:GSCFA domain-containing protein n=1 Tax=Paramylibacter kogurei TaxID=1889778 RepID=A0A2G5KD33_9RHOB|nr:GSCFA domain-containing protein [Amylibacter kogurei]PIB26740.1 hypothetical protein BFP76_10815 [Amylibacter kogurei]
MPIEKTPADAVYARLAGNKERVYPRPARGGERLHPYAQPAVKAGFQFDKNAKIFASGSCFARNIEKSLKFINANVVSSDPAALAHHPEKTAFQLYNKYTIHSILNEFKWALSDAGKTQTETLVEIAPDKYIDLQISPSYDVSGTFDEMAAQRLAYNQSFGAAANADVIIITLGLVEAWYDCETGVYLNLAPPKPLIQKYPNRFEFHLLDYDDIMNALCETYDLLRKGRKDNPPKMLFTVSPVGLASTFREQDVLIANCYSKSVQRAAIDAFVATHDASYFPSYEYVTLTDRKFAWGQQDYRHVRQETVDRIMADVLLAYVGPSQQQALLYTRGHAQALFDHGDYDGAINLIESYQNEHGEEVEMFWLYAQALNRAKRPLEAAHICTKITAANAQATRPAARTAINIYKAQKMPDELKSMLDFYAKTFPEDVDFLARYPSQN